MDLKRYSKQDEHTCPSCNAAHGKEIASKDELEGMMAACENEECRCVAVMGGQRDHMEMLARIAKEGPTDFVVPGIGAGAAMVNMLFRNHNNPLPPVASGFGVRRSKPKPKRECGHPACSNTTTRDYCSADCCVGHKEILKGRTK